MKKTVTKAKRLLPLQDDENEMLHKEISKILMDFVCYNQKPFGKTLQKFIAIGCHDVRASSVSLEIMDKIQKYLDEEK